MLYTCKGLYTINCCEFFLFLNTVVDSQCKRKSSAYNTDFCVHTHGAGMPLVNIRTNYLIWTLEKDTQPNHNI